MSSDTKLALPAFLKVLTNGNVSAQKAMVIAAKVYKTHNTPGALGSLTDARLKSLGVDSKEDRKAALAAFKKAGYISSGNGAAAKPGGSLAQTSNAGAGPSTSSKVPSTARKRKRDDDLNEFLPAGPSSEGAALGSFEFNEVVDEEVLQTKLAVVNRAPVMSLWATIVSERLGFKREEALSIASAYTEMNAISKGVSLGIFEQKKGKGIELEKGQSQPYVDLMGRRPLYTTQSGEWRALLKGEPIDPASAFSYISRAFRQTLPFVAGAMRKLADSFPPAELNEKGFGLYAEFRPDVGGWGQRAEIRCSNVLGLRKVRDKASSDMNGKSGGNGEKRFVAYEAPGQDDNTGGTEDKEEPPPKKAKDMTVEEYEAALDASGDFDDLIYHGEF
ncbi:uncharacterized protein FOMMEDRAFT_90098 [Fomitiporia mediterranea MF3/22]|uniref:uncharacterized protein n=1 Tax=Fomitiporia mediterranea (strain MF3/22) TaxID=694068 RepID=UPI00044074FB|nr:uncharacterized protein FOMMEDRAFT_90098 [Fomitiporia mediterranea MF3/22]EJD01102.1 hypothetical protein FOMMEDRAFT_90098 [Fomitiporia mediterranea MF3/22]